ncbi:MAG TPA: NRDE family protein [Tahibacter sp.]|uniref:NRDE family protein n=1 Tax=Tahibacter sp. TaxID=2056211 RepID=UPI002C3CB736|nr:NRDE family protein [Tahibacter sp.]HSX61369.1 NRDE family protein [Tahibacter sp.]
MCLLLVAVDVVPGRPLLLLGNRDEFHARASAAAAPWPDLPGVFGGRDLEAGGSWLAMHENGRVAAVTNVRLLNAQRGPRSRGDLVRDFVAGGDGAADYVARLQQRIADYAPFNLVVADRDQVWCLESPAARAQRLHPGVHLVSNGPLDAPWPKMQRLRALFEHALAAGAGDAALLDLLADTQQPDDASLPQTGVGLERERFLATVFIRGDSYGTRASTLAVRDDAGRVVVQERRFGPGGTPLS